MIVCSIASRSAGVVEQRVVVREPDPLRRRDQVGGVEREQQRPADRDDREPDDDHDRGQDERPGGRVLPEDPLGERPARCGRLRAHLIFAHGPGTWSSAFEVVDRLAQRLARIGLPVEHRGDRLAHRLRDLRVLGDRRPGPGQIGVLDELVEAREALLVVGEARGVLDVVGQRQAARLADPAQLLLGLG